MVYYKDVINSPEDKRLYLHLKTPSMRGGIKNGMALVRDQIKNSRHTIKHLKTSLDGLEEKRPVIQDTNPDQDTVLSRILKLGSSLVKMAKN